jgi:hypothetical protein
VHGNHGDHGKNPQLKNVTVGQFLSGVLRTLQNQKKKNGRKLKMKSSICGGLAFTFSVALYSSLSTPTPV